MKELRIAIVILAVFRIDGMSRRMLRATIKASAFAAILLIQLCLGDTLKAAPGQPVGGEMALGGEIESDLFIEAPSEISGWMLTPSEPKSRRQIDLTVLARTCWKLSVTSDRKNGRMAEYDPFNSSYIKDGRELESTLTVSAPGTDDHPDPWDMDLARGGVIQEGEETAGAAKKFAVHLEQMVAWTDEPLSEDHCYHATVIFSISAA